MDLLLLFTLASVLAAAMIARVIFWSTNRATSAAVTRYFKASEYILETGEPPPDWLDPPWHKRILPVSSFAGSSGEIITRFDDLVSFFEQCSFFEDEWTREQLLEQLARVRESWQDRDFV